MVSDFNNLYTLSPELGSGSMAQSMNTSGFNTGPATQTVDALFDGMATATG
jgi:hypothetical protein